MKLPEIKGFIDLSLIDWDGEVSAVIFLPNCNLRCPFCYNKRLVLTPEELQTIPYEQIRHYLTKNKDWLDGVAITGGEPTVHNGLPNLCKQVKELGLRVKLDTNGTDSAMLKKLMELEFLDYVAMDIKAPLTREKYSLFGASTKNLLTEVKKSVEILLESAVDYEFRTTLVPKVHDHNDIKQICSRIKDCKKYVLQNFKGDVETLDPKFQNMKPFPSKGMEEFLNLAREIVPNTFLRQS